MKLSRKFLIFCYGLFTIAAQSLLFREFITSFEGNDISIGLFFASWFLWIALAALLAYKANTLTEILVKNIELLFLAYLPAFFLQLMLIVHIRSIAGIEHYALLSIRSILWLSILSNAPVSIITGLLFPTACRWIKKHEEPALSKVYILEAAGSFIGGLGVTILLAAGSSSISIFFILALIVASAVLINELAGIKKLFTQTGQAQEKNRWFSNAIKAGVPLCIILFFVFGLDNTLTKQIQIEKWNRLLPKDAFTNSFQTAQAEYLYGTYRSQLVIMREGSVCEALPDQETTGRIAAISLCQKPDAQNILIIGGGLGVCRQFLKIPEVQIVSWAHCDTEYIKKINDILPEELRVTDSRLNLVTDDVRSYLAGSINTFDIVILNLPDAASSVLNRYYTQEFYQQVKKSLAADGIISVRISGGENIMGTELVTLGTSVKMTLQKVFSNIILVTGVDTWFIASDSKSISGNPGLLAGRFRKIENAREVFSPDALLSIYLPDRAAKAIEEYSNPDLPQSDLINSDSRPLTYLYSLLLAARQSGAPVIRFVKRLILAGPLTFFVPIIVFVILRIAYLTGILFRKKNGNLLPSSEDILPKSPAFDSSFLSFTAGFLGIGSVIVLMYLYQTQLGSLYLYIGIISSIFMLGLTIGAAITRYLISINRPGRSLLLVSVILIHTAILLAVSSPVFVRLTNSAALNSFTHLIYTIAFFLCGFCSGCYFPIAAKQLEASGFETGQAGSRLETADHIGACAGGLATSLLLVPVLGTSLSLLVFIALLAANLTALTAKIFKPLKICALAKPAGGLRKLGFTLFGISVIVIICSNLLHYFGIPLSAVLPEETARALAGQLQVKPATVKLDDKLMTYYKAFDDNGGLKGYIFASDDFGGKVRGFGGPITLAVFIDTNGSLINFSVTKSNETPSYLKRVTDRQKRFLAKPLFSEKPYTNADAVTGATITSKAITSALELSGRKFADKALGQTVKTKVALKPAGLKYLPDVTGTYLIASVIASLVLVYYGGFLTRLVFLIFTLLIGGLFFNAQFSTEQIATILSLQSPAANLSAAFLITIGIPMIVLIFGNLYCGYICPFGAAQELISRLRPAKLRLSLDKETMRKAGFVKHLILFIVITVFFLTRDHIILSADPLVSVFSRTRNHLVLWMALTFLAASFIYPRFWCLYLCPAGAFLSLLNRIALLKRYLPAKKFGLCEFGITGKNQDDCICCDRCLHLSKKESEYLEISKTARPAKGNYFIAAVAAAAIFVSAITINKFFKTVPPNLVQSKKANVSGSGEIRNVDSEKIRTMIEQKKLSDKEAQFYKKVD